MQLAVEVVRVGFYSLVSGGGVAAPTPGAPAAPIFAPTPRSFMLPMIPEEGNMEDQNLRRISNVLVLVRGDRSSGVRLDRGIWVGELGGVWGCSMQGYMGSISRILAAS